MFVDLGSLNGQNNKITATLKIVENSLTLVKDSLQKDAEKQAAELQTEAEPKTVANKPKLEELNGIYHVPTASNFPDIDSFLFEDVVFQMTTNPHHPYSITRMEKLYRGWPKGDKALPFIYVVPEDRFDEFRYQQPTIAKKNDKKEETSQGTLVEFEEEKTGRTGIKRALKDGENPVSKRTRQNDRQTKEGDVMQDAVKTEEEENVVETEDEKKAEDTKAKQGKAVDLGWIEQFVIGINVEKLDAGSDQK